MSTKKTKNSKGQKGDDGPSQREEKSNRSDEGVPETGKKKTQKGGSTKGDKADKSDRSDREVAETGKKKTQKGGSKKEDKAEKSDRSDKTEIVDESNEGSSTGSAIGEKSEGEFSRGLTPQEKEKDRELKKRISTFIQDHMQSGEKDFKGMNYKAKDSDTLMLILDRVRGIFMKQPVLLKARAPIRVLGDIHGQYLDLKRLLRANGKPPKIKYLFLGDYVDRGQYSLECVMLLFAYKCLFPDSFLLLRGNHECLNVNRAYGFFDEMHRRGFGHLYPQVNNLFNVMPLACLINKKILCMHGGISEHIKHLDDINNLKRPLTMMPPKKDIPPAAMDLLWSDPDLKKKGYNPSKRGVGGTFGLDVLEAFCKKHNLEFVARGHQVVQRGFERISCGPRTRCVTIFSAPNYCGEMDNCAATMIVEENLKVKFAVLEPSQDQVYQEERKKVREATPAQDIFPEMEVDMTEINAAYEKSIEAMNTGLTFTTDLFKKGFEQFKNTFNQ